MSSWVNKGKKRGRSSYAPALLYYTVLATLNNEAHDTFPQCTRGFLPQHPILGVRKDPDTYKHRYFRVVRHSPKHMGCPGKKGPCERSFH